MARYIVTVGNDENDGNVQRNDLSLREAIALANANPGLDRITFSQSLSGKTLGLSLGQLSITADVDIRGDINHDGKADITISGNQTSRIFNIAGTGTDVDLTGLTLTNGQADRGGAIAVFDGATLDLVNSTIRDSHANQGGAIYNEGNLTTRNVLIYHNSAAEGGGVYTFGSARFTNTTIDSNSANFSGDSYGGGVFAIRADVTFRSSTVTDNFSDFLGGGIALADGADARVIDSIFANRSTLGSGPDDVWVLFNGSPAGLAARDSFFTNNYEVFDLGGTIFGGDPRLGPLRDNGGPVLTRLPLSGSPAAGMGAEPSGRAVDGAGNNHRDASPAHDSFVFRLDGLERDTLADSMANSSIQFSGLQPEVSTYWLADDASDRFIHKMDMGDSSDHSIGVHAPSHFGHFDIA